MTIVTNDTASIIRTDRGLSIDGTRLTLYTVMDFYEAGYPYETIQDRLALTDLQMDVALAYINEHYNEFFAEYKQVLAKAEDCQREWDARLQAHLTKVPAIRLSPEQQALREKFRAWKAKREFVACNV